MTHSGHSLDTEFADDSIQEKALEGAASEISTEVGTTSGIDDKVQGGEDVPNNFAAESLAEYATGGRLLIVTAAIAFSVFLAALDQVGP